MSRASRVSTLRRIWEAARHTFVGVLHCACGARMFCFAPTKACRMAAEMDCYRCEAFNKDKNEGRVHRWVSDQSFVPVAFVETYLLKLVR